jgi:uncharacterized membrane protein YphA (DoxX/SURF4 family)
MLNPFPELLTYSLLAPFILRLTLGYILVNLGHLKLKAEKGRWEIIFQMLGIKQKALATQILAYVEIVGGLALIFGIYTQIAALIFVILLGIELYVERKEETLMKRTMTFYVLMFAIAFSLLFSGAGFLAFDLPL